MRATMKALAVLTFAVVLSQFFRSYLAVIAPEVMIELDLTPAMFGWLSSTFFLSFALAQIPVGIAFDRFGVRRPVALLLALGVAGAGTISVTASYPVALAAQACLGLACAPLYMALVYYASHHLPEQRFVQAITLTSAIGIGGAFMAAAPLGWATYLFGWRPALAVAAVLTLLTLLAVWRLVGDERVVDAAGGPQGRKPSGRPRAPAWRCWASRRCGR